MSRLLAPLAALIALALAAPAGAASPDLVVSQVYGGGGNAGSTLPADFIEIFNRGAASVPLGGRSLQYTSATGTGNFGANSTLLTELPDVSLAAGRYFLVQESPATATLPGADFVDPTPINLAAGAGKVALVNGVTSLGCNGSTTLCDPAAQARIVDLVGYGNANFFEGAGAAPTAGNNTSVRRHTARCPDTDDNAADFEAVTPPEPRSCDVVADTAPSVSSTDPAAGEREVPLDADVEITFSEPVDAADGAFTLSCTKSGDHAVTVSGDGTTFTLDPPRTSSATRAAPRPCTRRP
jgi:uncharacterized protein